MALLAFQKFCLNGPFIQHFISPQLAVAGHLCRLASKLLKKLIYDREINFIHRFTFFSLSAFRQSSVFICFTIYCLANKLLSDIENEVSSHFHSKEAVRRHLGNVENVFDNTSRLTQSTNSSLLFPRQGKHWITLCELSIPDLHQTSLYRLGKLFRHLLRDCKLVYGYQQLTRLWLVNFRVW